MRVEAQEVEIRRNGVIKRVAVNRAYSHPEGIGGFPDDIRAGLLRRFHEYGGKLEVLQGAAQSDDIARRGLDGRVRSNEARNINAVALLQVGITVMRRNQVAVALRDGGDEPSYFGISFPQLRDVVRGAGTVVRAV